MHFDLGDNEVFRIRPCCISDRGLECVSVVVYPYMGGGSRINAIFRPSEIGEMVKIQENHRSWNTGNFTSIGVWQRSTSVNVTMWLSVSLEADYDWVRSG